LLLPLSRLRLLIPQNLSGQLTPAWTFENTYRLVLRLPYLSTRLSCVIMPTLNLRNFAFLREKSQNYELCAEMIDKKVTDIPGLDSAWDDI
jgi:hypothetical protein